MWVFAWKTSIKYVVGYIFAGRNITYVRGFYLHICLSYFWASFAPKNKLELMLYFPLLLLPLSYMELLDRSVVLDSRIGNKCVLITSVHLVDS